MSEITTVAQEALTLLKSGNYPLVEGKLNQIIELDKTKKRGRKSKLDLTLEKLGYTREEMQKFWDDALEVNRVVQGIAKCGKTWKDLNEYQLASLVNLKEKTLKQLAEQEAKKKAEEEAKKKAEEDKKYYQEHFEEIVCDKLLNGVALTNKEFSSLVFEFDVEEVDAGEVYKNGQYVTTISCINGHYFEIYWRRDNSEWGAHQFDETPFEVKKVSQLTGYDLNMKPVYTDTWEKV